jgi:hypothetical protein
MRIEVAGPRPVAQHVWEAEMGGFNNAGRHGWIKGWIIVEVNSKPLLSHSFPIRKVAPATYFLRDPLDFIRINLA